MYKCTRCNEKSEYKSTLTCPRCLDDTGPRMRERSTEVVRIAAEEVTDYMVVSAVSEFVSDLLDN